MTSRLVMSQWAVQAAKAATLMQHFREYAEKIGCVTYGDEIQATAEQSKLLNKWWKENT